MDGICIIKNVSFADISSEQGLGFLYHESGAFVLKSGVKQVLIGDKI
jgi:hypothetical protein